MTPETCIVREVTRYQDRYASTEPGPDDPGDSCAAARTPAAPWSFNGAGAG